MQIDINEYEMNVSKELGRLTNENIKLRTQVFTLIKRVEELEKEGESNDKSTDKT